MKDLNKRVETATSIRQRNETEVGKGHIDNKRGELKRLATPAWEKAAEYYRKLEAKIYKMIDGLIDHLEKSRDKLTADEIKAAEDFAKFQHHTRKENEHLEKTIAELTKQIEDLNQQLVVAEAQLKKREKLRDEAKAALEHIKEVCRQKKEYYEHETKRRNHEIEVVKGARKIFESVLARLSKRIRERTNSNIAGRNYKKENELTKHVVNHKESVENNMKTRTTTRNKVVFF